MKQQSSSLKNNFLISMPVLGDNKFHDTMIYICHQGEYGSMGIIINQEYNMDLKTMLEHLKIPSNQSIFNQTIFHGGDVQNDRGFILHPHNSNDSWLSSYKVSDELSLTSSVDILEAMAIGKGPSQSLIAMDYTGWGPGELELELINNLWLNCPVNLDIIFDVAADEKMQAAASLIGVKLDSLTSHSGKA